MTAVRGYQGWGANSRSQGQQEEGGCRFDGGRSHITRVPTCHCLAAGVVFTVFGAADASAFREHRKVRQWQGVFAFGSTILLGQARGFFADPCTEMMRLVALQSSRVAFLPAIAISVVWHS